MRTIVLAALVLAGTATAAPAQYLTQPEMQEAIFRRIAPASPRTAPDAKQVTAPSGSTTASTLVDRPGFAEVLGLAFGSDIIKSTDGVVTADATLFTLVAAAASAILDRQEFYERYELLRRIGFTAALGGKGQAFDRDGDGDVDAALTAANLGDIVNWEVRLRVSGSRDRRAPGNFARYLALVGKQETAFVLGLLDFLNRPEITALFVKDAAGVPQMPAAAFEQYLDRPDVRDNLQTLATALAARSAALTAANEAIDRQPLWTIVAGGVERSPEFGEDTLKVALRGVVANSRGVDHTLNLDWSRVDRTTGQRPTILKFGYEASALLLQEVRSAGLTLSGSVTFERYADVPDAAHETVAKIAGKLEVPVGRAGKVPFTVLWANHEDLLTNVKGLVGHVGFSWDLSALKGLAR